MLVRWLKSLLRRCDVCGARATNAARDVIYQDEVSELTGHETWKAGPLKLGCDAHPAVGRALRTGYPDTVFITAFPLGS